MNISGYLRGLIAWHGVALAKPESAVFHPLAGDAGLKLPGGHSLMSSGPVPATPVRFGVFEADLSAGELRRNGVKVRPSGLAIPCLGAHADPARRGRHARGVPPGSLAPGRLCGF
jgi:hypothetical protein